MAQARSIQVELVDLSCLLVTIFCISLGLTNKKFVMIKEKQLRYLELEIRKEPLIIPDK